jgi:polysaccharide export outer membrane protein
MTKPEIQVINLTTWEGVKAANLRVEPGDIIYIEPRRRVYRQETLQDVSGVIGTVGTILSTIISVVTLSIALSR